MTEYFYSKSNHSGDIKNYTFDCNTTENIINLCDKLQDCPDLCIYISIGGASNEYKENLKSDQQYPMTMRKLKEISPHIKLIIMIIDPELINFPSHVVFEENRKMKKNWERNPVYNNIYHNYVDDIHIISISKIFIDVVHTEFNTHKYETLEGDKFLNIINNYSVMNKWLLHVNDFTGLSIEYMASCYDVEFKDNLSHIIYGNCTRESECFIDMTDLNMELMYFKEKDKVYVLNINNYKDDLKTYYYFRNIFLQYEKIIKLHLIKYLEKTVKNIYNMIGIIRYLKYLNSQPTNNENIIKIGNFYNNYKCELLIIKNLYNKKIKFEEIPIPELIDIIYIVLEKKIKSVLSIDPTNKLVDIASLNTDELNIYYENEIKINIGKYIEIINKQE